jgi:p-methyltransferase
MNAQRETPKDLPADLEYLNGLTELAYVDGNWLDAFELMEYISDTDYDGQRSSDISTDVPNHACMLLAAYLRRNRMTAKWINSFDQQRVQLSQLLSNEDPLVTCLTTTLQVHPGPLLDMVQFVRMHNTSTKIVVGGPFIWNLRHRLDPELFSRFLTFVNVDYCITESEGEATLWSLINALRRAEAVDAVPNLWWRDGEKVRFSRDSPENNAIEDLVVDWDLFEDDELAPLVWIRTALSCAFKCSFCDFPTRMGALRTKSIDQVRRELLQLKKRGVSYINVIDDTFNVPADRFEQLLKMMVKEDIGVRWTSFLRLANIHREDTFDLLVDSGCLAVFLGIESANAEMLRNMHKGGTVDHYRRGIEHLNQRGILSEASFVVGFPGETVHTIRENIRFLEDTSPTFFHAFPFFYNPLAPIRVDAQKFGLKGGGFNWQHETMNSVGAHCAKEIMFRSVANSCWIPEDGFALWSLPHLLSRGMTKQDVLTFCGYLRDLIGGNHVCGSAHEDAVLSHAREVVESLGVRDRRSVVSNSVSAVKGMAELLKPLRENAYEPRKRSAESDLTWVGGSDGRISESPECQAMFPGAWLPESYWAALASRRQMMARQQMGSLRKNFVSEPVEELGVIRAVEP